MAGWHCPFMVTSRPAATVSKLCGSGENLHGDDELRYYPGSPWFSLQAARDSEHLRLFELHPTDFPLLAQNICDPRVRSEQKDGFAGLKAVLPPPPRRALVLIDPPYEDKKDYQRVVSSLQDALKRFANGVYAVWYPCLQRFDARDLPEQLKQLPVKSWLHIVTGKQIGRAHV